MIELSYTLELINLLELKNTIIHDVRKIDVKEDEIRIKEERISSDLIENHNRMIYYIRREIEDNVELTEKSKNKYRAFHLYHLYQIFKLQRKNKFSSHQEI